MDKVASLLTGLFQDLNLRLRWILIFALACFAILSVLAFEYWTGNFYYSSLQKKVSLLKEMQVIANEGIASNTELYPVYKSTVEELARREVSPFAFPAVADPVTAGKAISGASIWIIFAVLGLFGVFGPENKIPALLLLGLFAILVGYISTLIPTLSTPWLNYLGVPIIQLIILFIAGSRKRRKAT